MHYAFLGSPVPAAVLLIAACSSAFAAVTLPALFSDHMVLQCDKPIPIWGSATPGEKVQVLLADRRAETAADVDGKWRVDLAPLPAGGPFTLTVKGRNTVKVADVLVGEVWVCSGQSNMEWPVSRALNATNEIAQADHPSIRLFIVRRHAAETPQEQCVGQWRVCSPKTVPGFSAVGYFFGRDVHGKTGAPVGLIEAAWSATALEVWTDSETVRDNGAFSEYRAWWGRTLEIYKARASASLEVYKRDAEEWPKRAAEAKAKGEPPPPKPLPPLPDYCYPSRLFNGMIFPLVPFAIRGVIWYQGEANTARADDYRRCFPAMIRGWRRLWKQGDFPFLFVQLANFGPQAPDPGPSAWAALRDAQRDALQVPHTGMAVAIDVGLADNVHPPNKQEVGRRLALLALNKVYGHNVPCMGPFYRAAKVECNVIRVSFDSVYGGLIAKGDGPLTGFDIAGADRKFVHAEARIDGNDVIVHSAEVGRPVAVRYAWADNPVCNLYNRDGLPASPFRTDDWAQ